MKLKEIVLGCENCDCITIEGKYIQGICLENITESYVGFNDVMELRKKVRDFALFIDKNANKKAKSYTEFSGFEDIFKRIELGQDIVDITLIFEENNLETTQCYSVYWDKKEEHINLAQNTYICEDGRLCLVISKKKKLKDFFDIYEVLKRETVDFHL